jgi:3-hydroxy acid dehydrogenase/malonic semialdehyde reductase
MATKLTGKIVLITGASSGIGEACVLACAAAGANIIMAARRAEKLKDLAARIEDEFKVHTLSLQLDIMDPVAVVEAFANLPTEWSNIDILINNAGIALTKDHLNDTSLADIQTMINTNLNGLIYITKCVLPNMLTNNHGHIINIGSTAGQLPYAGGSVYCATKAAVIAFTDALKKDLLGTQLRVSHISPGMVKTELSIVRFKGDTDKADAVYANTEPLFAEDIAETVLFCITRPAHVNISEITVYPTTQVSPTTVHRKT